MWSTLILKLPWRRKESMIYATNRKLITWLARGWGGGGGNQVGPGQDILWKK